MTAKKFDKAFIYVNEKEATLLDSIPEATGKSFSSWGRDVLLAALEREKQMPPISRPGSAIRDKNVPTSKKRELRRAVNMKPKEYAMCDDAAKWRGKALGTWAYEHLLEAARGVRLVEKEQLAQARLEARQDFARQIDKMLSDGMCASELRGWLKPQL